MFRNFVILIILFFNHISLAEIISTDDIGVISSKLNNLDKNSLVIFDVDDVLIPFNIANRT